MKVSREQAIKNRAHVVEVAGDVDEPDAEQLAQLLLGGAGAGDDLPRPGEQRLQQLVADRDQEVVLAVDVVVDAAGGKSGRRGQFGHRGRLEAALGEDPGGVGDDLLAATVIALAQRRSGWG